MDNVKSPSNITFLKKDPVFIARAHDSKRVGPIGKKIPEADFDTMERKDTGVNVRNSEVLVLILPLTGGISLDKSFDLSVP